jgi:hypothetical protein
MDKIAKFCICRVHDVRDLLLDDDVEARSKQVLSRILKLLEGRKGKADTHSLGSQIVFLESALTDADLDPDRKSHRSRMNPEVFEAALKKTPDDDKTKLAEFQKPSDSDKKREYQNAVGRFKKVCLTLKWGKEKIGGALFDVTNKLDKYGYHTKHKQYGHISTWDVRDVTDMPYAFAPEKHQGALNGQELLASSFWATKPEDAANVGEAPANEPLDLSFWDTRNVNSMYATFYGYSGSVEVGTWDTSNVTNMAAMFADARDFNGDIRNWDTGLVENMSFMFANASQFNGAIGNWSTSKVKYTDSMFSNATEFNQDLSAWNLDSLKQSGDMFHGSGMENVEGNKPAKVRSAHDSTLSVTLFGQPSLRPYV